MRKEKRMEKEFWSRLGVLIRAHRLIIVLLPMIMLVGWPLKGLLPTTSSTSFPSEGYVRFGLNDCLALSVNVQHMDDAYEAGAGDDANGWIFGIRMTAEF